MSRASNPHDEEKAPTLHRAFEDGWEAFRTEKSIPDRYKSNPTKEAKAWLDGYAAAQSDQ